MHGAHNRRASVDWGPLDVAAVFALVDVVLLASLSDRRALSARVVGGFVAVVALSFLVEL